MLGTALGMVERPKTVQTSRRRGISGQWSLGLGGGGGFGDTTARRPESHCREVLPLISDMPGWSPLLLLHLCLPCSSSASKHGRPSFQPAAIADFPPTKLDFPYVRSLVPDTVAMFRGGRSIEPPQGFSVTTLAYLKLGAVPPYCDLLGAVL
jgi:hypothetical protein